MVHVESCELCASLDWRILIADPDRAHGTHGDVVRCRNCGLMFRNRRKPVAALSANYDSLDYERPPREWIEGRVASFRPYLRGLERWRRKQVPAGEGPGVAGDSLPTTGRICEVGAGHGFTLAACREAGWDVHGVEVAGGAVAYAKRELGLGLRHGTLREVRFPDGHFDVVLLWNVLDEVPHPRDELSEALRILRPGGGVLVRVRNGAFHVPVLRLARLFRRHAQEDCSAVVHLYAFDRTRLHALAEQCGFCAIRIRNARLTWTVMHGTTGASGMARKLVLWATRVLARSVSVLSASRLLFAPSLVMAAEKPLAVESVLPLVVSGASASEHAKR